MIAFELVNFSVYLKKKAISESFFSKSKQDDTFFIHVSENFDHVSFRFRTFGKRLKLERCTVLSKEENKVERIEIIVNESLDEDFKKLVTIMNKVIEEPGRYLGKINKRSLDTAQFHLLRRGKYYNSLSGLQLESETNLHISSSLPDVYGLIDEMFLNTKLDFPDFEKRFKQAVLEVETDLVKILNGNIDRFNEGEGVIDILLPPE